MKFELKITNMDENEVSDVLAKITGQTTQVTNITNNVTPVINPIEGLEQPEGPEITPAAPAVDIVTPVITGNTDSTGMPWDKRIHGGTAKKPGVKKDGTWKRRRNIDDETFNAVEAELKASVQQATPAGTVPTQPVTVAPPAEIAAPAETAQVAAVPPAAQPATPPAQPTAAIERDFNGLMQHISNLFAQGKVQPDYPNSIVTRINTGFGSSIASLPDIAMSPEMVLYAWQCIDVDAKAA